MKVVNPQSTKTEPASDDTKAELLHDESTVVENENVVTLPVSDETIRLLFPISSI